MDRKLITKPTLNLQRNFIMVDFTINPNIVETTKEVSLTGHQATEKAIAEFDEQRLVIIDPESHAALMKEKALYFSK